jgi:uncharacterized membrane protein
MLVAGASFLFTCGHAHAAFTVCNQMLDIANVAIGESAGDQIETRGWWVVAPNRCADVIPQNIKSRYVYVHALDVRGRVLVEGTTRFCTAPRQFKIAGTQNCWERGYTSGTFKEVDTKDADSWTLFLREQPAP